MELREYQKEILNEVVGRVISGQNRLCVTLPTGAGKSLVVSKVVERLGKRAWFVVPRLELLSQAADTFTEEGIAVGIINAKRKEYEYGVCIVSLQTLQRNKKLKFPEVMIFDEAHVSTEAHYNMLKEYEGVVLGFTATPERVFDGIKGLPMCELYSDGLVKGLSIMELQRQGYLAPIKYMSAKGVKEKDIQYDSTGNVTKGTENKIVEVAGDVMREWEKHALGMVENTKQITSRQVRSRPTFGFFPRIAVAQKYVEYFNSCGHRFELIDGGDSDSERKRKLNGVKDGTIQGLFCADLLTYGVDCPPVSYVFSCRPTKSLALHFQCIGRGLRIYEGKEDCIFVDHVESYKTLGKDGVPPVLQDDFEFDFEGVKHLRLCVKNDYRPQIEKCRKSGRCLKVVKLSDGKEHKCQYCITDSVSYPCTREGTVDVIKEFRGEYDKQFDQCQIAERCLKAEGCRALFKGEKQEKEIKENINKEIIEIVVKQDDGKREYYRLLGEMKIKIKHGKKVFNEFIRLVELSKDIGYKRIANYYKLLDIYMKLGINVEAQTKMKILEVIAMHTGIGNPKAYAIRMISILGK